MHDEGHDEGQRDSGGTRTGESILYCLVPADKPKLHELLDRHFQNFDRIKVVAEHRGLDRRSRRDRRHGPGDPPRGTERRRTNPEPERRGKRRRAAAAPVRQPVPLPPEASRYADQIVFVERLPDSGE